jgi:hypothetical protein
MKQDGTGQVQGRNNIALRLMRPCFCGLPLTDSEMHGPEAPVFQWRPGTPSDERPSSQMSRPSTARCRKNENLVASHALF